MKDILIGCAVVLAILIAAVATWIWVTIPSTPDAATLPSQPAAPPAPAYAESVAEARAVARTLIAEEKLPGLSVAVAIEEEIVWAEGFRWADLERQIPVTPATSFRIGGVTQSFSAVAVGILAARGALDLDAPVQRHLPDFPDESWPITIRQLMAHSAGLRGFRGEGGIFVDGPCDGDAARLTALAGKSQLYRPGTQIRFSTRGWALVGAVIGAASNSTYLDFVRGEILLPLGLQGTAADVWGETPPLAAHFYYPRMMLDPRLGLQDSPRVELSCHLPAVGLLSTPSDLVTFGAALMGGRLLDPAIVEILYTPLQLESGEVTDQALGWIVRELPLDGGGRTTRIVGQGLEDPVRLSPLSATTVGGQVAGSTATLLLVPEYQVAIAVAANVSGARNVPLLAERLVELFVRAR